jgi:hypothetical protein
MKIDKVIFSVDDNPLYEGFWEIQSKICSEILGITPVLFKITDNDTDFYKDKYGLIKHVNKNNCPGIITSFLSQIIRMYGTKYFPNEVCITGDIDMIMFNKEYFVDSIEEISEDDLIIFDADAYNPKRPECENPEIFAGERYPICYSAAKGLVFNKILDTDRPFSQYAHELGLMRLGWGTDEIYFGRCVNNKNHGVNVHKTIRPRKDHWIIEDRIDRHNFPIHFVNDNEREYNQKYGNYDKELVLSGFYKDAHCPRPYNDYKQEINNLIELIYNEKSRLN